MRDPMWYEERVEAPSPDSARRWWADLGAGHGSSNFISTRIGPSSERSCWASLMRSISLG